MQLIQLAISYEVVTFIGDCISFLAVIQNQIASSKYKQTNKQTICIQTKFGTLCMGAKRQPDTNAESCYTPFLLLHTSYIAGWTTAILNNKTNFFRALSIKT